MTRNTHPPTFTSGNHGSNTTQDYSRIRRMGVGSALTPVWSFLAFSLQGHGDPLEGDEEEKDSRNTRDLPPPFPQADHHLPARLGSG
jgi:hypothetical protein